MSACETQPDFKEVKKLKASGALGGAGGVGGEKNLRKQTHTELPRILSLGKNYCYLGICPSKHFTMNVNAFGLF